MKHFLSILITIIPLLCIAQKQGNIWYFGDHAGLDFNNTPPTPLLDGQTYISPPYGWNEGCSVISDSTGSLLFYSNGEKIWNRNHQIMPNGDSLKGHRSSTQSCIIVPQPKSSRYFYVFTTDASENDCKNGLRYSIVDMCLDFNDTISTKNVNYGLGDVIAGKKNIKLLDSANEKLICIKHSNGFDYWIITHKNNSDAFYSFRLTNSGIIDTIISHIGTIDSIHNGSTGGQMVASPNGLKIAYAKPSAANGFTLLLDFNPSIGVVSNERVLSTLNTEYGVSFSPDNSKLYFTKGLHIYQYNLNAGSLADIISSKFDITQSTYVSSRSMQLAPDNKIYIARAKNYLSMIEFPDSLCPICNFIDSAVYLGGQISSFGLPNLITGYNYSNTMYNCESGINEQKQNTRIIIYPNPSNGVIQIKSSRYQIPEVKIYNAFGEIVFNKQSLKREETLYLNLSNGVYFIHIISKDEITIQKIIIRK